MLDHWELPVLYPHLHKLTLNNSIKHFYHSPDNHSCSINSVKSLQTLDAKHVSLLAKPHSVRISGLIPHEIHS